MGKVNPSRIRDTQLTWAGSVSRECPLPVNAGFMLGWGCIYWHDCFFAWSFAQITFENNSMQRPREWIDRQLFPINVSLPPTRGRGEG